jgi:hypothetical protein
MKKPFIEKRTAAFFLAIGILLAFNIPSFIQQRRVERATIISNTEEICAKSFEDESLIDKCIDYQKRHKLECDFPQLDRYDIPERDRYLTICE